MERYGWPVGKLSKVLRDVGKLYKVYHDKFASE